MTIKRTKDNIQEIIEDLVDEERLETFRLIALKFAIGFDLFEKGVDSQALAFKILSEFSEIEDDEKALDNYKEELTYDEWAMSLVYAASTVQVAQGGEDESPPSYIG